ncbi:failed axon connections homolog [Pollicipes pollicipes]|uniref:failed axon connections homolog n=1 Tax=Pollicipes pollicipes TaxID=41117 RepID=UPI001884D876|nr:failed axon connections homolog [Pollicipes pollicipes]
MEAVCARVSALLPDDVNTWLETAWGYRATRILVGLALLRVGLKLYSTHVRRRRRAEWAAVGRDVVVLHQFARARSCPNISPFAVKVETYLRANNITYVVDDRVPFGPRGKCPWITLNGREVADSTLIIDHIAHELGVRMTSDCSERDLACGRAFQVMFEERTAWGVFFRRYVLDRMRYVWPEFPKNVRKYMPFVKLGLRFGFARRSKEQGIGLFSEPELMMLIEKDLLALSTFLGDKQFMLGSAMTELDCCVFGMVVQLLYISGPHLEFFTRHRCPNLVKHCERIKELYWQDWDQCLET